MANVAYILNSAQMAECDRVTIARGISSRELMRRAGENVARVLAAHYPKQSVLVLCGCGNNGGDGFIAAAKLRDMGWPVRVVMFGSPAVVKPDAKWAADVWNAPIERFNVKMLVDRPLLLDAVFGTGLSRAIDDSDILAAFDYIRQNKLPCIAVDLPSGINADTGEVMGASPQCELTITFFKKKLGHVLLDGKSRCGKVAVVDIGIHESVLRDINPTIMDNHPSHWLSLVPAISIADHKYSRGAVWVRGGDDMTGAACLAARAARYAGAGAAWIGAARKSAPIYALDNPGHIVRPLASMRADIKNPKVKSILLGPGCGQSRTLRNQILLALQSGKPVILDADALRLFAGNGNALFAAIHGPCIMTPHAGEFAALFGVGSSDKITVTRNAAQRSGAVIVHKGSDTIIAAPDGRVAVQSQNSSKLATAGSGDVLAGTIAALAAQSMPPFDAACAGVYAHAMAALWHDGALVAEDLPAAIGGVLTDFRSRKFPY